MKEKLFEILFPWENEEDGMQIIMKYASSQILGKIFKKQFEEMTYYLHCLIARKDGEIQ